MVRPRNEVRHAHWPWGLGVLALAWVFDVCADSRKRKHAHEVKQQVQDWENEGGAVAPHR